MSDVVEEFIIFVPVVLALAIIVAFPWLLLIPPLGLAAYLVYRNTAPRRYPKDIQLIVGALGQKQYGEGWRRHEYEDSKIKICVFECYGESYYRKTLTIALLNYPNYGESTTVLEASSDRGGFDNPEIYRPQGEEQWECYLIDTLIPKAKQSQRDEQQRIEAAKQSSEQRKRELWHENHSPLP